MSIARQKFEECFKKVVPYLFSFLESDYGFTLTQEGVWQYIAEASHLRIRIQCDTGQLFLVSLIPKMETLKSDSINAPREVGLSIIMRGLDSSIEYSSQYCRNIKDFQLEVSNAAELVKEYCVPFLKGDFSDWPKVEARAEKEVLDWRIRSEMRMKNALTQQERRIREIRAKADEAFQNKDYVQAIDLYESIEELLTELEIKKLNYMKHTFNRRCG